MIFAFIFGRLRPGHDGVGDYVARLSCGLQSLGHRCLLIAACAGPTDESEIAPEAIGEADLLLLQANIPWRMRAAALAAKLREYNPDLVSLQYVPYAFQRHGLPLDMHREVPQVLQRWRRHIYFHEIWIGSFDFSTWRERAIGLLQRALIQRMVRQINPSIVHTHCELYVRLLQDAGVPTRPLPLFSNIEVNVSRRSEMELRCELAGLASCSAIIDPLATLILHFGTFHRNFPWRRGLDRIAIRLRTQGLRGVLVFVGNNSQVRTGEICQALRPHNHISVVDLGFRTSKEIGLCFQACDLLLTTNPPDLLGKSGTIAAGRFFKKPILVVRDAACARLGFNHCEKEQEDVFSPEDWEPRLSHTTFRKDDAPFRHVLAQMVDLADSRS